MGIEWIVLFMFAGLVGLGGTTYAVRSRRDKPVNRRLPQQRSLGSLITAKGDRRRRRQAKKVTSVAHVSTKKRGTPAKVKHNGRPLSCNARRALAYNYRKAVVEVARIQPKRRNFTFVAARASL